MSIEQDVQDLREVLRTAIEARVHNERAIARMLLRSADELEGSLVDLVDAAGGRAESATPFSRRRRTEGEG